MKKVLFATTALVATAGVASADVALTGSAEMGIIGGDGMETQFHTDIDVTFTMSGETDNGLTFGATIDLDESDGTGTSGTPGTPTVVSCTTLTAGVDLNGGGVIGIGDDYSLCSVTPGTAGTAGTAVGASAAFGNTTQGGETIFLSGDFGTITMGDTDGAFDWALTEVSAGNAGSINDDETAHGGYSGNAGFDGTFDGQILRYDYSVGGFGVAVSAEIDDSGVADPVFGLGFRYSFEFAGGSVDLGLGYQEAPGRGELVGVSVSAALDNGLTATVNYWEGGDTDGGGVSEEYMAIGIGYTFDAFTVYANYGEFTEGTSDQSGFGFAAAYDLGGGASVHFGYGDTQDCGVFSSCSVGSTYSFGVAMSF